MAVADSGKGGSPIDFAQCVTKRAAARAGGASGAAARQSLEYMADMILELSRLAARSGHITLAELLDVAHREAEMQHQRS